MIQQILLYKEDLMWKKLTVVCVLISVLIPLTSCKPAKPPVSPLESPIDPVAIQERGKKPQKIDLNLGIWYTGPITDSYAVETTIYAPLAWTDIAIWDNKIWSLNNVLQEIVAFDGNGTIVGRIAYPDLSQEPPPNLIGLTYCQDKIWITDVAGNQAFALNSTGEVMSSFSLKGRPQGMTCDGLSLWIVNIDTNTLDRYDFEGNELDSIPLKGNWVTGTAWDGASLWYVDTPGANVWRYNPTSGEHEPEEIFNALVSDMSFNGIAFTDSHLLLFQDMVGQLVAVKR
jgi:hypothetical protein